MNLSPTQQHARDAARRLHETGFCVIDTETTGLTRQDAIVQISVVYVPNANDLPIVAFETLVKPPFEVADDCRAFQINGMKNAYLKHALPFDRFVPIIDHITSGCNIVAYNSEFDASMIWQSIPDDVLLQHASARILNRIDWICAMRMFAEFAGFTNNGSYRFHILSQAYAMAAVTAPEQLHNASSNAMATAFLLRNIAYGAPECMPMFAPGSDFPPMHER